MKLTRVFVGLAFSIGCPGSVPAGENASVVRGTAGLAAVPFQADNAGVPDIRCSVALAHWYSQDLGPAASGASVRAMLWSDPATGEVFLLNALADRMPVQTLWCGTGDRAWTGRATIPLERRAGTVPAPIHVVCRATDAGLACR